MGIIPINDRRNDEEGDDGPDIGLGPEEPAPSLRRGDHPEEHAGQQQRSRIFAHEGEAQACADRIPPSAPLRFDELRQRKQGRGCKERERRVGRGHNRRRIAEQRCIHPEDAKPGRGAVAEKAEARLVEKVRSGNRAQQSNEANAELRLPENRRSRPDPIRNHRRMIVISGGEVRRPEPVIGFVLGEICCRGEHESQKNENCDCGKAGTQSGLAFGSGRANPAIAMPNCPRPRPLANPLRCRPTTDRKPLRGESAAFSPEGWTFVPRSAVLGRSASGNRKRLDD